MAFATMITILCTWGLQSMNVNLYPLPTALIAMPISIMGTVLFLLALLIFAYPALIAYFIAAVILFAGFSALAIGWKLWRLRNKITKIEKIDYDPFFYRIPETHNNYFTYIRW